MGMRAPSGMPKLSRRSRILLIVAVIIAALLLIGPRLLGAYIDWLWFGAIGFREVFSTILLTRIALFFVVGLVVGAIVFGALLLAYRMRPVFVPVSGPHDPIARYRTVVMSRLKLFGLGIPIVVGVISGLVAQSKWAMIQLFLNGGSFGIEDPQFHKDVGFYAFDLPFIQFVLSWLFAAVLVAFFVNLVTHYVFGGLRLAGRDGTLTKAARAQLAILAGTFLLLKAVSYWFDRYSLLTATDKEPTFTGMGYTDANAVLPSKLVLMAIAIICAGAFFAAIVLRDLRIPALATALMVLSSILVGAAWPLVVEQFSVKPNAADKERTYIERNIQATREAYGITKDNVTYVDYPGVGTKAPQDVPADVTTIANTRLLDPNLLSPTFTQQQQLQNFYGFPSKLAVDRYTIDGKKQDYVVAAREMSPSNLTGNQTDWINKYTVYTHGDGFIAAPANQVTASGPDSKANAGGYPIYKVSDLASQKSGNELIKVTQPRIYYGEVIAKPKPDYAIVGGKDDGQGREYDGQGAKYTYTGSGGVSIGNWFNRLAFAAKYGERNILFSGAIGSDSKILFDRDPRDRVQKVAPWLTTDGSAYPAVVGGRIVWIVDGYTTLDNFPYAQRTSLEGAVADSVDTTTGRPLPKKEVSYIRNSVKAVVDAYDGTVKLYQVDKNDPVLKAWMKTFPGTVQPESAIDKVPGLREHFRYPEDLFKVQREMLAKYHVSDPVQFFNGNGFWSVPNDPTVDTNQKQPPYYVIAGNPDTGKPEFELTSPMNGFNRQLLSAYISVDSDPENYGKFTVLQLPTQVQTQGPQQAQNTMKSDPRVSSDKTLFQSNKIQYGNLLTLPIADGGILYVEPLYAENSGDSSGSTFPQLSRVLVSYSVGNNKVIVGYAPALAEALSQVFGPGAANSATAPSPEPQPQSPAPGQPATPPTSPTTPSPEPTPAPAPTAPAPAGEAAAVGQLNAALQNLSKAQSSGDFNAYGQALAQLQTAIDNYEKVTGNTGTGASPAPAPSGGGN
ncbi:UPF0182 family protein [Corynebacteriales bacterium D3-21]|uniref:UPF0182 protein NVS88_00715 n=2 Tax=Speluncibacter jeojiensis TaxID=2710754 RepID=A0A9X4M290_9ACTN|nr:UPF0182 family protein [Corynebacteriales bacterium D3-21]